jgi:hypothetical protein
MTKRCCHSEGAFRNWRIFSFWKHTDSSSKQKQLFVGATKRLCHSEGAFRDWRIILYRKHTDSSSKQKKLFCRNDNMSLSFWRSFSRLKNHSLSKTYRFLVKAKKAFLSEWQYVFVILKELFATEESFLFRKH